MPLDLSTLEPGRLAATLALAAGAVRAGSDRDQCDVLLQHLCALVGATSGCVVRTEGDAHVVHAAFGCGADSIGRSLPPPTPTTPSPLTTLAGGTLADVLSVPLVVWDRPVGTLDVGRGRGGAFVVEDRAILDLVSPRLAALIERHRVLEAERHARASAADAVEALRLKEEHFEAMCNGAFEFIGLTTPEGRLLEVNRAALEFAGVERADVLGLQFWDTPWWSHDQVQRERLRQAMAAAAAGETGAFVATHVSATGQLATVDFAVRPAHVGTRANAYLVVEGRDVTVRDLAQKALTEAHHALKGRVAAKEDELARATGSLHAAQALYRAVAETIVDGVVVIDHHGTIEWTNPAACTLFGRSAVELTGQNVRVLMPQPYEQEHDAYLTRYLATGERRIIGKGREVRGLRKDGSEFPLYLAVGQTAVNGDRKFVGILRDLSANKHLERQLQERQTLAQIGELAAVVAHEVRNPLAAIRGVVEVIRTRFPEGASDRKILGDLLDRVDSLDQLVSDLLVYSRPAQLSRRPTSILGLVRDTAAVVGSAAKVASVRFEVTGEEAELEVDGAQMSRVLLNLMTNAAQAMRYSGVVRVAGERTGATYRVTIDDQGPGMPPEVLAKCLEPFFTTKTRGTGLGLSIAKRVVVEHGGTLGVTSEVGRGTSVVIELPLSSASV